MKSIKGGENVMNDSSKWNIGVQLDDDEIVMLYEVLGPLGSNELVNSIKKRIDNSVRLETYSGLGKTCIEVTPDELTQILAKLEVASEEFSKRQEENPDCYEENKYALLSLRLHILEYNPDIGY